MKKETNRKLKKIGVYCYHFLLTTFIGQANDYFNLTGQYIGDFNLNGSVY